MRIWRLALQILVTPDGVIRRLRGNRLSIQRLLFFLGVVGLLRGALEAIWLYAMAQQPALWMRLAQDPGRYAVEGAPFVAANGMTAYLRWVMYTVLFLGIARWFGRTCPFVLLRDLTGLALGLYLVPVAVNILYLFFPLPVVQFPISDVYQPIVGLGTWVASVWFGWIAFRIFRAGCGLANGEALLGAVFIPLFDKVLFIGASGLVFRWRELAWMPVTSRMVLVTVGFLAAALVALPFFIWMGRRLAAEKAVR